MSNRHLFTQSLVPPWPVVFLVEIPAPWFIQNDLPGTKKCFLQHIEQHQTIKKLWDFQMFHGVLLNF